MGKFRVNKNQAITIIGYFFGPPIQTVNGRRGKMKARDLNTEQVKFAEHLIEKVITACFRMGVAEDLYESSAGTNPEAIEIIVTVAEGYKGHVRTRERNRRNPLGTNVYNSIRNQVKASYRSAYDLVFGESADAVSGSRTNRRGI